MAYATDIGIDLGTSNIVIYIKGKGIVLREPAMIAYDRDSDKIKAYGQDARQMIGRTPSNVNCIRPLKDGIITDYLMTEKMLRFFIHKAMGRRGFLKPRIVISVPSRVTDVERRAVEEATYQAGAREVFIVEDSIASAIGAGIDIARPSGNLIVDIGGGATNIAIITMGGIAQSTTISAAGNEFTKAIVRFVRKKYMLFIGEQTAEAIKRKIGSASRRPESVLMEVRGRNVFNDMPNSIQIRSNELAAPLREIANKIADAACSLLEQTTPELASDIAARGIVLTGGGSLLKGIDEIIAFRTGIDVIAAPHPENAVAIGTGRYLEVFGS